MPRYNSDNENELLLKVSQGDEKAFKVIFSTYYDRLFHYISGFTKSKEISEELANDVFLKIWLGKEIIPQIEKFDAFLFRVAHNKSIDFLRSVAKDPKFRDLLWYKMELAHQVGADAVIITHEYEAKLREAISLLSPQRKKVYRLSREQDMTHDQIAAHLNLSRNTVNNHIVEAQRFIRTYLSKNCDLAFLFALAPAVIGKI